MHYSIDSSHEFAKIFSSAVQADGLGHWLVYSCSGSSRGDLAGTGKQPGASKGVTHTLTHSSAHQHRLTHTHTLTLVPDLDNTYKQ